MKVTKAGVANEISVTETLYQMDFPGGPVALRLHAPNAEGLGSIPDQRTHIICLS